MSASDEQCACCLRIRPTDQAAHAMGADALGSGDWVTFEAGSELVIDVPDREDVPLPFEVVDAIRAFDGLVRLERLGPEVKVASVREVYSRYGASVCPDCLGKHEDWDDYQWRWHLSVLETEAAE